VRIAGNVIKNSYITKACADFIDQRLRKIEKPLEYIRQNLPSDQKLGTVNTWGYAYFFMFALPAFDWGFKV
jgi:hypothetical protein